MSTEPSFSRVYIPSLTRRVAAKAIDFTAVGFTVVGFSSATHSYLAGLLIGCGWLALSDWAGSLGKWVMKLEVRDHGNLSECSASASFARNLPIIAVAFPHKLHQALLGMDRQQYREAHSAVIVSMACVALIVLVATLTVAFRTQSVVTSGIISRARLSFLEEGSFYRVTSLHRDAGVSETLARLGTRRGDKWDRVEPVPTMPVGTRFTASVIFIEGSTESRPTGRLTALRRLLQDFP